MSASASRVVYVTVAEDEAAGLARVLVDRGVAACVNLVAVRSIYRWEGQVHDDPETLLIIKTHADRVPALRSAVVELHSYDVPEFLVLPVEAGLDPYDAWVRAQTAAGEPE